MSYVSIDIDIDEILYEMNRYERRRFLQHMQEDGIISKACVITNEGEVKAPNHIERLLLDQSNDEFDKALQKLFNNGWKLTSEEEQYIIDIAKRFP